MTARTTEPEPRPRPSRSVRGLALASVIADAVLICTGAAVRLSSSGLGCSGFPLQDVTQLYADIGCFIGALAVALVIGLRLTGAPASAVRTSQIVLTGLCVQAAIGYAQYFSHLPAGLVWVHVAMSVALWIFVLRLYLSIRKGGSVDNAEARAGHGYAVTPAA